MNSGPRTALHFFQHMPHLVLLDLEVVDVLGMGMHLDRYARRHGQTVAFQADDLFRVVRQELDLADAEIAQDLGADAIVAEIGLIAEGEIRLDSVLALVLELVSLEFSFDADAASLLA